MSDTKNRYGITKAVWAANYILAIVLIATVPDQLYWGLGVILGLPLFYLLLRYPYYAMIRALSKKIYDKNGPKASADSVKMSQENKLYYTMASMLCLYGLLIMPFMVGELIEAFEWVTADERKDLVGKGVGITYGLMLIMLGNKAPKMVDPADIAVNSPAWSRSFLKFAGFTGIILGILVVADFLVFDRKPAARIMVGMILVTMIIYLGRFIILYRDRRKELAAKEVSEAL